MAEAAIAAQGLGKRLGPLLAHDGVDLELPAGGVLGLPGPSRETTTTVRILATLLKPDRSRARVAGRVGLPVADGPRIVPEAAGRLAAAGLHVSGLALRRPPSRIQPEASGPPTAAPSAPTTGSLS